MKKLDRPNWKKKQEQKKRIWLIGAAVISLSLLGGVSAFVLNNTISDSDASYVVGDTHLAEPVRSGDKILVKKNESFQKALNLARPGDTILLEAGATFQGSFELPFKRGDDFITIRSSAPDNDLPAEGQRIQPNKHAAYLPKLRSNIREKPVISTQRSAHHYRFVGIEFMPTIEGLYNIVRVGTNEETKLEHLPHHIEFDRVYVHGSDEYGQRRGIAANGRNIKITNSHISNIKRKGEESQAIAAWATDGPVIIENNYLEAAGENILFGGADAPLMLTPTGCVVRNNHLNKPLEWKGTDWVVKNLFEIKNGKNIKIQNNLMTRNWAMGQDGSAILFTVREDSGKDAFIEDIEFSNNIVRGSGNAINILGSEGKGGRNLVIRNNLFDDIDNKSWGGNGNFLKSTQWDGLIIENNTIIQSGNITNAYGAPIKGFVFRNNIVFRNEYGFFGDSMGEGKRAIERYFPGAVIEKNIIIGGDTATYGKNNYYPASIRQIDFVDLKTYVLRADSPYRSRGHNDSAIGASVVFEE